MKIRTGQHEKECFILTTQSARHAQFERAGMGSQDGKSPDLKQK
jgi:hypothetical protein